MSILYLPDEVIKIKIDGVEVGITQLKQAHKLVLMDLLSKSESSVEAGFEAAAKAIKFSVKSISGIKLSSGKEFKIELEDGVMADESVEALLNFAGSQKLQAVCLSLLGGFSGECKDLAGNDIPGVSMVKSKKK